MMNLKVVVAVLLTVLLSVQGDEEIVPGDICIWDADNNVRKGCAAMYPYSYLNSVGELECDAAWCAQYFGNTVDVCKSSSAGDYEIAFEVVIRHDNGGRLYYAEDGTRLPSSEWYLMKDVEIEVCKGSDCSDRTEKQWRYMSYGNRVSGNFGTGNIIGKDWEAGSYEILALATYIYGERDSDCQCYVYPEELTNTVPRILTINLFDECNGDEDLVLD